MDQWLYPGLTNNFLKDVDQKKGYNVSRPSFIHCFWSLQGFTEVSRHLRPGYTLSDQFNKSTHFTNITEEIFLSYWGLKPNYFIFVIPFLGSHYYIYFKSFNDLSSCMNCMFLLFILLLEEKCYSHWCSHCYIKSPIHVCISNCNETSRVIKNKKTKRCDGYSWPYQHMQPNILLLYNSSSTSWVDLNIDYQVTLQPTMATMRGYNLTPKTIQ